VTALASEPQPLTIVTASAREHTRWLEIFAARLFDGLAPDVAAQIPAQRRAQITAAALEFFSVRAEPIKVRVVIADQPDGASGFAETVMQDCPFIIDSLLEYFHHLGIGVGLLLHPVLLAGRDTGGRLVSLEGARAAEQPESFVHLELRLDGGVHDPQQIAEDVKGVLEQVRCATGDFEAMTARALEICEETAAQRELVEVRDLLRWLVGGGFALDDAEPA
jgi:NAD-specific glutamate dehydrogenase